MRFLAPILLCLGFVVLLTGCEGDAFTKVVDVELDDPELLPVLYADWSTSDTVLYVIVTETLGVLDEDDRVQGLPNLRVTLQVDGGPPIAFSERSDGFFDIRFSSNAGASNGTYYALVRPANFLAGAEVNLTVAGLPDGGVMTAAGRLPSEAVAQVTRLTEPTRDTVWFDPSDPDQGYYIQSSGGELSLRFDDAANEPNYYQFFRVDALVESTNDSLLYENSDLLYGRDEDTRFQYVQNGVVFRDVIDDGRSIELTFDYYGNNVGVPQDSTTLEQREFVYITTLTESTYSYLFELDQLNLNEGNPFAEPIVLGSNVEGGLGHLLLRTVGPSTRYK